MIVVDFSAMERMRHLSAKKDSPLCGANPAGAFVVESMTKVTCPVCIEISNVPAPRRSRPGSA